MSRIVLLLLALPALYAAGDSPLDRATLRGIKALNVIVDNLDPNLERDGLTKAELQTEMEDRLKKAGVPIDRGAPEFLGLTVLAVRPKRGPYGVAFAIGLYQPVILVRNREVRTATQTWESHTILLTEPKILAGSSMSAVDELTDHFISAWSAMNPK